MSGSPVRRVTGASKRNYSIRRTGSTQRITNSARPAMKPKPNAKYLYKIYPEYHVPEKVRLTTHSKIFEQIFAESPDWKPTQNDKQAHYTDNNAGSRVKSFFKTKTDITTKIFLAKTLQKKIQVPDLELHEQLKSEAREAHRVALEKYKKVLRDKELKEYVLRPSNDGQRTSNDGQRTSNDGQRTSNDGQRTSNDERKTAASDDDSELIEPVYVEPPVPTKTIEVASPYYPPTLVCKNGKVDPVISRNQKLWNDNKKEKWFLKTTKGYGGSGIYVFIGPQQAKEQMHRSALGFPSDIVERNDKIVAKKSAEYVLQRGIEPHLMQGFKFDIRIWVLFVFEKKRDFRVFIYDDAFLRVSSKLYNPNSTNTLINLTNLTFHGDQKSVISKTYTLKTREYYQEVFPKICAAVADIVGHLKDHLAPGGEQGFEIMGYDFILDQNKNPWLLEINRHIGYPVNARNKSTVDLIFQMLKDTIDLAIVPQELCNASPKQTGWVPVGGFTI